MRMKAKLLAATAIALTVVATVTAITAAPAYAQAGETCLGTVTYNYSPPLTDTPQTVTVTAHFDYPSCDGVPPAYTSATIDKTSSGTDHCGTVAAFLALTVQWNVPSTSDITFSHYAVADTATITTLVGTGTVTAGELNGGAVVQTEQFQRADILSCSTATPLSTLTASSELDITGG